MENTEIKEISIKELILKYPNYYDLGKELVKLYDEYRDRLKLV